MNILMVLTSHDQLGNTGRKTGFWLEEFAAPYYAFLEAGAEITVTSPKGGQPPLDPKSDEPSFQTEQTRRFHADPNAQVVLASTVKLASISHENMTLSFTRVVMGRSGTLRKTSTPSLSSKELTAQASRSLSFAMHQAFCAT